MSKFKKKKGKNRRSKEKKQTLFPAHTLTKVYSLLSNYLCQMSLYAPDHYKFG